MQNDLIKQWAELSKKANESLKKINSLNTKSIKQLTKLQMDMVSSCLEGGIKKAKNVGTVKSVSDLMNLQSEIYKELSEKVLASAQSSVKVAMETKQAMSDLVKEGLADAPKMVVRPTVNKTAAKPAAERVAPKKVAVKPVAKKVAPKKVAAKPVAKKAAPKKVAAKPVAKKAAPKKVSAKPVAKKAAPKKVAVKPVAKKVAPKKVAAKPVVKKVAPKKVAIKPEAKKIAPTKAAAKPVAKKPAPKQAVAKPADKLQMPKPSGRPMTEGDAKK